MKQLPVLNRDRQSLVEVRTEHRYIANVVRTRYPVRAAKKYLRRYLGNVVELQLVEIRRGEDSGCVRAAEILSEDGTSAVFIDQIRTLPDGSPASFFTPSELVQTRITIETEDGSPVPALRSSDLIVLHVPVQPYTRFLPSMYRVGSTTMRRDVHQVSERDQRQLALRDRVTTTQIGYDESDQFKRFLFLFQHMMTSVIDRVDDIPNLTDPLRAERKFLVWLASWVNFPLDESLPLHMQRELVRRAIRLNRKRGTKDGLAEMVRILTSAPVEIKERARPNLCALGSMTLAGGSTPRERFYNEEPPASYLYPSGRDKMGFFTLELEPKYLFRRRFGDRAGDILDRIVQVVSQEMPASVLFTIRYSDDLS